MGKTCLAHCIVIPYKNTKVKLGEITLAFEFGFKRVKLALEYVENFKSEH
jgi:hypothetical protein